MAMLQDSDQAKPDGRAANFNATMARQLFVTNTGGIGTPNFAELPTTR